MKFSYKFSNLLGAAYKKGNLLFTPDGNSIISPVSNKINIFDLRNNKTYTLPIESKYNYVSLALSKNGNILIAVNEEGECHTISLISQTIVNTYRFKGKVRCVRFSPDGKHVAFCKENNVFVFKAPGHFSGQYNTFVMERVYHTATDETTCLSWSSDSRLLAVGSKDMTIKIYAIDKFANFRIISLRNHTDSIVACFFEKDSYDIITISRNGQMCVWECNINPDDLVPWTEPPLKKKRISEEEKEDDIDDLTAIEKTESEIIEAVKAVSIENENTDATNSKDGNKIFYKKLNRHYLADEVRKDDREAILTCADYHTQMKFLVVGFSNGSFFIYEMPDVNLVHSLNISNQKITSVTFNGTGDWIGLGCSNLGQLLVWEWQSETYVMKQQGHANNTSCVSYSFDGEMLASGGEDGKVKLWNINSGLCFITFNEHANAVNAIRFSGNKKFVVSASLDGTVRAYDVIRYRNFRTFAGIRPVQFTSVAVDVSGEFVAAGAQDVFEIYLWSVKTGKLLEILTGHEGPVGSMDFSPLPMSNTLVSVSWDKTLRIWDAIEKGSAHETIELTSDGVCVVFNPNGQEVAVATLDGHVHVFEVKNGTQISTIEGRYDLGSGIADTDLISAKKSLEAKSFTSLCYSADGEYLLAGGQSKNVCIYNVKERLLVRKFEITQNRSLDAVDDFINRRKLTEFGNLALVEEREEREGGPIAIRLPGVRKGDMASRSQKPEVRLFSLQFSPTGQQWAAATTEGILVYSLNLGLVFDPWDLQMGITPSAVRKALKKKNFHEALIMSMKLNEQSLILEVIENIPLKDVELIVSSLSVQYVDKVLVIVAGALGNSNHLEFYLIWIQFILSVHGPNIKKQKNLPSILNVEKVLSRRYNDLSKICDHNKYTMQYIIRLGKCAENKSKQSMDVDKNDESDSDDDEIFEM
ncbi:hypothetical protein WA026_005548 [Henosepilachna vigintioctopunctata]|uniref:Small-subunit processome Utp12 domain-containing protein n=1 Tax=Henosepilachna vigintioctopunctata TaxID=420089 RepID=A0AAW1TWP6_9CUCU